MFFVPKTHTSEREKREIFRKKQEREIFLTKPYTLKNRRAKKKARRKAVAKKRNVSGVPSQTGRRATAAAAAGRTTPLLRKKSGNNGSLFWKRQQQQRWWWWCRSTSQRARARFAFPNGTLAEKVPKPPPGKRGRTSEERDWHRTTRTTTI